MQHVRKEFRKRHGATENRGTSLISPTDAHFEHSNKITLPTGNMTLSELFCCIATDHAAYFATEKAIQTLPQGFRGVEGSWLSLLA